MDAVASQQLTLPQNRLHIHVYNTNVTLIEPSRDCLGMEKPIPILIKNIGISSDRILCGRNSNNKSMISENVNEIPEPRVAIIGGEDRRIKRGNALQAINKPKAFTAK